MRFEYYNDSLADVPKLAVDGTVGNAVHFSHWQGNKTDPSILADTSTEIALNAVSSSNYSELTRGIELVTNNHFDTDGLLSVWTMLNGKAASEFRAELVATAESGDFSEFPNPNAVRASIIIQGSEYATPVDGVSSPLARELNLGMPVSEARAYELLLPLVPKILKQIDGYEHLWLDEWQRIESALGSFENGSSKVVEHTDTELSEVLLDPDLFAQKSFRPIRHIAPYTAIAHNARGKLFLIAAPAADGWTYRIDYPYYSWAVTVVRPPVCRYDFSELIEQLNHSELQRAQYPGGRWQMDDSELASAVKFTDQSGVPGVSPLDPDQVVALLNDELRKKRG